MAGLVLYFIRPFIVPLVTGLIFAMVLAPLLERWAPRPRPRGLKAAVLTLGFAGAFLAPLGIALYVGTTHLLLYIEQVRGSSDPGAALLRGDAVAALERWMHQSTAVRAIVQKLPVSEDRLMQLVQEGGEALIPQVWTFAKGLLASLPLTLLSSLIILATIYFLLAEGHRARSYIDHNPVFSPARTQEIVHTFRETSFSIVVASVVSGLCQAAVLALACLITGKGSPLLIGLLTFVCSFLPLVGTGPMTLVLVTAQLLVGDYGSAAIFLGLGGAAATVDNLLVPWLVGDHAQIHPLLVLISACGGVETIGIFGLFVGPVVTATFLKTIALLTKAPLLPDSDSPEPGTESTSWKNARLPGTFSSPSA